jgi:hypothetical protein
MCTIILLDWRLRIFTKTSLKLLHTIKLRSSSYLGLYDSLSARQNTRKASDLDVELQCRNPSLSLGQKI